MSLNPDFDFRDMLGGASAKVGGNARNEKALNRDIAIGEDLVARLHLACISAVVEHGSFGNPVGVTGFVMARIFGAGMAVSEDEGRRILDRFRGLIDTLEAGIGKRG